MWWATEVAPVLDALITDTDDRAMAEVYLIETVATYAACRWCGHQHGTAGEQVEADG